MSTEALSGVQLYDGTLKGALIGSAVTVVSEYDLNQILVRSADRNGVVDFGAIHDSSISYSNAREVARYSGRLAVPPRLLFAARLSLPGLDDSESIREELDPILEVRKDIHREHRVGETSFHYSDSPMMIALFVRTDPRVMEHLGDTWTKLISRTVKGLRILHQEGIPGILVTQSTQAHTEAPKGFKELSRVAIAEGVREIWIADTREGSDSESVTSAVHTLRQIICDTSSSVAVGFMGTGVNAVEYTELAVQGGATSVYGVEKNRSGHLQYAEIDHIRPLLFSN